MAEVNLVINGRDFGMSCDDGQEQRVIDLGHYVDQRMKEIASSGAASNETHLLILTALMLSDEIFDLRDQVGSLGSQADEAQALKVDEAVIAGTINQMAERIDLIAERMQKV